MGQYQKKQLNERGENQKIKYFFLCIFLMGSNNAILNVSKPAFCKHGQMYFFSEFAFIDQLLVLCRHWCYRLKFVVLRKSKI
jgi:hypothetical protein